MTSAQLSSGLRAVLSGVAANGILPRRELRPNSSKDALGFLLDQIDTCVMARRLSIVADGTINVTLDASERRLLSISRLEGLALGDIRSDLIATRLFGSDTEHCAGVAEILIALCDGCQHVSVTAQPLDMAAEAAVSGISVRQLQAALGLDSAIATPVVDLPTMVKLAGNAMVASFSKLDGWRFSASGPPNTDALIATIEPYVSRQRLQPLIEEGSLLILELDAHFAGCLTLAEGDPVAVIVTRNAAAQIAAACHKTKIGTD